MSAIEQIKKRIDASERDGVETSVIREDYEPVGQIVINDLTYSGEYVQRKTPVNSISQTWKIYKNGFEPY